VTSETAAPVPFTMAKKKDSEKHEDGQKGGKHNKDDADANELENFVDDITDEGKTG